MSRFGKILSDEEIQDIWNSRLDALGMVPELDLIRMGEQAAIAKLHKQMPPMACPPTKRPASVARG